MYLYLVRHGQSVGNVRQLFYGWSDHPLTDVGRADARAAGKKLKAAAFTRCCASDLSRAMETTRLCLGDRDIPIEPCPGLREQDMGEFEDLNWDAAEEKYGQLLHDFVSDWFHTTPPGGESPEHMAERVARCVDAIIRQGEDTLVVAHNGSLSLILKHLGLAGDDELLRPGWFFQHGAYTAIRVDENGPVLLGFNL